LSLGGYFTILVMDIIQDLAASLRDPHARHAMMVHLPIVLALLGVPLTLAVVLLRRRAATLTIITLLGFLLASCGAALAANSGEDAEHNLKEASLTQAERSAVHDHEELGENGWIWPLIPAVLLGLSLASIKRPAVRTTMTVGAFIASLGVGGWVVLTAHAGGALVYTHGLGVPARASATAPAPPPSPGEEREGSEPR